LIHLQVTDDSGFLALIDPDAYSGFVTHDWDLDDVVDRFRREMAARHLLIWGTGVEGCWTVEVSLEARPEAGAREVVGSIVSSRGRLLVTNYESLTMAAQFEDVTLPEPHQVNDVLDVTPGTYRCRIVQRAREASNWAQGAAPEFLIELLPAVDPEPAWTTIPWADLD
jgi:hypothetical protein